MRRLAWTAALLVAAIVASAAGAAAWLLYSESGLRWLTTRVAGYAGKGLTLDGVSGSLAGGAAVKHIRYAGEDIELHVYDAALSVAPWSLLAIEPRIERLRASAILVTTKPTEPRGRPPDTLALPVDFELADARVGRLVIDLGKGPLELSNVRLDYAGGRNQHRVTDLTLDALEHALALRGTIAATPPFRLDAAITAVRREQPRGTVYASVRGTLEEIALDGGAVSGDASATFSAGVKPYDPLPLQRVTARSTRLDLAAMVSGLPKTALDLDVAMKRSGELYAGTLRASNAAAGAYDRGLLPLSALRAELRTDGKVAHLTGLTADFGAAGTLAGSGTLERDRAKLQLRTDRLNLAGLHSQLRETRLAGRADMTLTRDKQSIAADLAEKDISLRMTAHRVGNKIDVPQFLARARGGEASGEAHLTLAARRPFAVDATLDRFDPAAWGRFPPGSINATIKAAGALTGPEINASFIVRDSRWLGAPLAGRGAVALSGERLRELDLDATLGGNTIVAKGALGLPQDTLGVRFNAPRLAIVDPRLKGSAKGTVNLSGSWRAPGVRFDIAAADLAHEGYGRLKSLDARGTLSTNASGPFDVDAALRGLAARQGALASADVNVKGTRNLHTAVVRAQGDRIDFRARATGAWTPPMGWSGTVEELVNRGEAPLELAAPVRISVAPQRAQAQAFELRGIAGRLQVKQLAYDRGRLSTAGSFTELPLRPVLGLAGVAPDAAGTLRLNGTWSISSTPQVTGSIHVSRHSGDVTLGADKTMRIGLQTLAVDAELREQGASVTAQLRSALANATAQGRAGAIGGRYTGASPIAFTADIDVARLAPFATFIDTTMLIEGEAKARLTGGGTLGDPRITGPLTADRLAVALPAEGIDLKGGTLRAQLTDREVRVESFSIRGGEGTLNAQGTLARIGFNEASLDWRADRFTVLSRPDRRLVVTGKGNAALRGGKLAFTGALRANEGAFELATTTLPTLGDDVVVIGREAPRPAGAPAEPRTMQRAAVDLALDLGNNVHVKGRGLDVWLSGEVKVQTNARGELRANGTVDARRGTFVAYGQRLEIEHGRLYFNGPLGNPGLDILAVRKRLAVEPGVAVTGTLARPLVRVVSNPALPEGEALSWLVLGRAPGTAGAGQLAALPLATGAIAAKAGGPIARALRVDEIGMRGSGAVSEQFLTVGKRISDRFYVVFEQSLGGAENLLRLEYIVTERIGLRAQAGRPSSLGVFYRYGWD